MHDAGLRFLHRAPRGEPEPGKARFCQYPQLRPARQAQLAPSSVPDPAPAEPTGTATTASQARDFTEHTVRIAFEVLNKKRPVDHLRHQLDPVSLASMRTLSRSGQLPARELGPARLETVGVQMVGTHVAEVFGSYRRGRRLLAFAGRIVRRSGRGSAASSWVMTAFRIC